MYPLGGPHIHGQWDTVWLHRSSITIPSLKTLPQVIYQTASTFHKCIHAIHHLLLKRSIDLGTIISQSSTIAPDIANLLPPTSSTGTILCNDTTLRLKKVILLHQRLIVQHGIGQVIVECSIHRGRGWPGTISVVDGPRVVIELPYGDLSRE